MELNGPPHCFAWWDAAREKDMVGVAELICIHSLKDNRRKGYGRIMMRRILDDIEQAGYSELILWVFDRNMSAIMFYETHSFAASGRKQPAFGAIEEMYVKSIRG